MVGLQVQILEVKLLEASQRRNRRRIRASDLRLVHRVMIVLPVYYGRARRLQHEFVDNLAARPSVLGSLALSFTCSLKCNLLLFQKLNLLADVGDIFDVYNNILSRDAFAFCM